MTKCNSCGDEISEGKEFHIRREWKKRGWSFCDNCVTSLKARKWTEEHERSNNKKIN